MSFHHDYAGWLRLAQSPQCPVCTTMPMPEEMVDIVELPNSWLSAEPVEPLRGACHLTAKQHALELYELDDAATLALMSDLRICARALKDVTDAVKINYEIHGNTLPHLHIHLYPRYLDDPFAGEPIDHRRRQRQFDAEQFECFIIAMRARIAQLRQPGQ